MRIDGILAEGFSVNEQPSRRAFLSTGAAWAGAAALSATSYQRVLGANERVGLGLIGFGLIGKQHVRTFKDQPDAEFRAVAEVHAGRLAEARACIGGGVQGHGDFRKLLDDKALQAVLVATPDHWHALMTMLACAASKDVYVEKPLTLFVREGDWMLAVAERTRRIVQCGTQQRSGKHYQRARELIRSGHIGKVTSVCMLSVRNVFPGFGRPADQSPPGELTWDMWLGPAPARPYNPNRCLYHFRWFWDYSGGQMTNLGAHHLDIVDWYLGLEQLKSVAAIGGRYALEDNGETPDVQDAVFDCDRYMAAFTMRECSLGSSPGFGLEFFGTRGSLGVSRSGFRVVADSDVPPTNLIPGVREGHPAGGPKWIDDSQPRKARTEALEDRSGSSDAQYQLHARDFLDCVKSRRKPISDLASGQRVAVACHLANLSMRLGRSLRWDSTKQAIIGDEEANRALVRPYRPPWDRELKALGVGS
jgi:predicted dehydrogenase